MDAVSYAHADDAHGKIATLDGEVVKTTDIGTTVLAPDGDASGLQNLPSGGVEHYNQEATPTPIASGATWFVPSTGITFKWVNDGTSDLWIDISTAGAGASGGIEVLAELTKTFIENEDHSIALTTTTSCPNVAVQKTIPGSTGTDTSVDATLANYEIEDYALATTLTPSAVGDGTFTLGSGSFTASHVHMRIEGNGGIAVLTGADGSYITLTDFNDTTSIPSGGWTLKSVTEKDGSIVTSYKTVYPSNSTVKNVTAITANASNANIRTASFSNGNSIVVIADITETDSSYIFYNNVGTALTGYTDLSTSVYGTIGCGSLANDTVAVIFGTNSSTFSYFGFNSSGSGTVSTTAITGCASSSAVEVVGLPSDGFVVLFQDANATWFPAICVVSSDGLTQSGNIALDTKSWSSRNATVFPNNTHFMCYGVNTGAIYATVHSLDGTETLSSTLLLSGPSAVHMAPLSGDMLLMFCNISGSDGLQVSKVNTLGQVTNTTEVVSVATTAIYNIKIINNNNGFFTLFYKTGVDQFFIIIDSNLNVRQSSQQYLSGSNMSFHSISLLNNNNMFMTGQNNLASSTPAYTVTDLNFTFDHVNIPVPLVKTGGVNVTTWSDINDITLTETLGTDEICYALSTDARDTWKISKTAVGDRNIVRNNLGTWEYNSNETYASETWTAASINTEFDALKEAIRKAVYRSVADIVYDEVSLGNTGDIYRSQIIFSNDKTKAYLMGITSMVQFSVPNYPSLVGMTSDSKTLSFSGQESTLIRGGCFNSDGSKFYALGTTSPVVYEYSIPNYPELTSAVYNSKSFSVSFDTGPAAIHIDPTESKMLIMGRTNRYIYQCTYNSTDFSLSSYDTVSFDVSSQFTDAMGMFIHPDGANTKMYISALSDNTVYQYSLPDYPLLSNTSYDNVSKVVGAYDQIGITFSELGDKMYLADNGTDTIRQFSCVGTEAFNAINKMTSTTIDALSDAEFPAITTSLDATIILNGTASSSPAFGGMSIDYDSVAIDKGAINGTDYEYYQVDGDTVNVKALVPNDLKIRIT